MKDTYYNREDLKKFGNIAEFQKELGEKFFDYYESVHRFSRSTTHVIFF